jgi:hypothetical protein
MISKLWQVIKKHHLDEDKKITDDQWNEFVSMYENHFADEVSRLADEFFTEYKINQLKQYD